MSYLYHFCVSSQSVAGRVEYYSGIANCTGRIDSLDRYNKIREDIAAIAGFSVDGLTVNSLTFLHETDDKP